MNRFVFLVLFAAIVLSGCAKRPLIQSDSGVSILCIVRHAEAFKNLDPPPADMNAADLDALTKAGRKRARKLGKSIPRGVTVLWSSPTNRTRETATELNLGLEVVVEPALRAIDDGESAEAASTRVREMLEGLHDQVPPGEHAVIVTHEDIATLALEHLRGRPIPDEERLATGKMACSPLPGR